LEPAGGAGAEAAEDFQGAWGFIIKGMVPIPTKDSLEDSTSRYYPAYYYYYLLLA
jgi:hypothetical protein